MIRKLILIASVQCLVAGCATTLTMMPSAPTGFEYPQFQQPDATKVVLVVLENTNPDEAKGQPFLRSLAASGSYLSNYYAVAHPSQPNYIALFSGSTQGVDGDSPAILDRPFLGEKGQKRQNGQEFHWKAYAEGYPSGTCDLRESIGSYVKRHVPPLSFKKVQNDPEFCRDHITGFEDFLVAAKAHSLPSFSLVVPNLDNDAHDQPLSDADAWLERNFRGLLNDPEFQRDVLLIVTFDENDTKSWRYGSDASNKVFTVLWGNDVKQGYTEPALYNHYDLLRTIETIFGIKPMACGDVMARPIGGIWRQKK